MTARCSTRARRNPEPVRQADRARDRNPLEAPRQRREVGHVKAPGVDAADAPDRDGHSRGGAQHAADTAPRAPPGCGPWSRRARESARRSRMLRLLVVDEHAGGHQRAGERAPPRLVGARHEPRTERAIEAKELRRPPPARPGAPLRHAGRDRASALAAAVVARAIASMMNRRPGGFRAAAHSRGSPRKDRDFSRGLEEPDAVGRPVGEEGLADDPVARDRAPEAAVVARPTVVAHHEVVVGRDRDRLGQVAAAAAATRA